jgi:hypothetical protein
VYIDIQQDGGTNRRKRETGKANQEAEPETKKERQGEAHTAQETAKRLRETKETGKGEPKCPAITFQPISPAPAVLSI